MKPSDIDLCGCSCCKVHRREKSRRDNNLERELILAARRYIWEEAHPGD